MTTAWTNDEDGDSGGRRRRHPTNHHRGGPVLSPATRTSATTVVAAHKKTPAAAWKDALRRSCVERARHHHQRRRRASESPHGSASSSPAVRTAGRGPFAATTLTPPSSSWNDVGPRPTATVDGFPSPLVASPHPPPQPWTAAQEAVAQTLQHWGVTVTVGTPLKPNHHLNRDDLNNNNDASSSSALLVLDGEYCMTEEEWYELLQDVEDDLKRAEEAQLDDLLDDERRYMEEQVADYERWQEEEAERRRRCDNDGGGDDGAGQLSRSCGHVVVCPLCQDAPLAQTPDGSLTCPNRMDGSCPLHLEARPGLSLSSLRHSLAAAFDEHNAATAAVDASQGCPTPLQFEAVSRPEGGTSLVAYCSSCRGSKLVA